MLLLVLTLAACGSESQRFKMEGKFAQLNQGEFYLYSPDGAIEGIDTIHLQNGRFSYSVNCSRNSILVIVFPNYSEQPVFAEPGKTVSVKGEASHLKEMRVTGSKLNKQMNNLREQLANASPIESRTYARQFIEDHPDSYVGAYLVGRYFLQGDPVDPEEAFRLVSIMHEKQPDNAYVSRLFKQLEHVASSTKGARLPDFTATDVNGKTVSSRFLASEQMVIVNVWASWNIESCTIQRELKALEKAHSGAFRLVGISLDGSPSACQQRMERDTITWTTVCESELFDGKLAQTLGIGSVPDNFIVQQGRIVERSLGREKLLKRIKELLQQ
ncbi:MAG: AhpC/TSA family protein [Prevotella sp.]|nr:AhpC/TSA family protein [Prevotella sp.]